MIPLSALPVRAAHFFQYTDRALCTSIFSTSLGHTISHVNLCLITKDQCVPIRLFHTQVTGFTHHRSCRSSHLFPCLNFLNLPHPCFFLLVTPFSSPNSFCPVLSSNGGERLLHNKLVCFHEQRQGRRTLFFLQQLPSVFSILTSPWETSPQHGLPSSLLASYLHVATS